MRIRQQAPAPVALRAKPQFGPMSNVPPSTTLVAWPVIREPICCACAVAQKRSAPTRTATRMAFRLEAIAYQSGARCTGQWWWLHAGNRQNPFGRQRRDAILSTKTKEETMTDKQWDFVHNLASEAKWTPGLREIFEYRDLGIKAGTKGDYVAHLIRHNGKKTKDEVQQWHVHDCTFQLVYVLNGWATFEYDGQGQHTIRKGDCILQTPGIKHREIACSDDFEVLEIVSPANFATRIVEAPQAEVETAE
jgi:mannose-6-phosphate isomerase-like protein (cupin superfamily)